MNKAFIVGNLTRAPEMRKTHNDVSVCMFTVACNRLYKNADGEREADFIPVVTWRGLAENCYRYLQKGSKAAVAGMLQTRSYEGKDGVKRYVTELVADEVEFLGGRKDDGADMTPADDEEDMPF